MYEEKLPQTKQLIGLPPEYTNVQQSFLDPKDARCPISEMRDVVASDPAPEEQQWLEDCRNEVSCNTLEWITGG
jgi:hypothetical protein